MFKLNSKKLILILLGLVILVGVGGYRYYQSTKPQTPAPAESQEPTAESKWKLYTNSEYGFSVEVPVFSPWLEEKEGFFYTDEAAWVIIMPLVEETSLGVADFLKQEERDFPGSFGSSLGGIPDEPNAIVGGKPAVLLYYPKLARAPAGFETFVVNNGKVVKFLCSNPGKSNALEVYRHILETFRFDGVRRETRLPEFPKLD